MGDKQGEDADEYVPEWDSNATFYEIRKKRNTVIAAFYKWENTGKGPIKRTQQTPFDPAGSDDIVYSVREIKVERVAKGNAQWLVGWENFPDAKHDTWEPVENLAGLETLISEFRQRFKEEQELLETQAAAARGLSGRNFAYIQLIHRRTQ
ncbi:hypothetical protein CYMTET_48910 [Cymbomonas tetramitiformis]|uniref:Chromo domain-containing protein n=1 Tax=Cymbomonas tetramitiformis TaxID=36881 RepID=A0AAE0BT80_9CHLO|nr:hypothetical protein CYMTET_48910 [Cymbomonas tetramitiformis]